MTSEQKILKLRNVKAVLEEVLEGNVGENGGGALLQDLCQRECWTDAGVGQVVLKGDFGGSVGVNALFSVEDNVVMWNGRDIMLKTPFLTNFVNTAEI